MEKIILLFIFIAAGFSSYACPVCERAKAKITFGSLTHGTLPTNKWEYVAVWVVVIMVFLTLFYTIKWLIKPSETNKDHIKYSILNSE